MVDSPVTGVAVPKISRTEQLRSLPVGLATIAIVVAGAVIAIVVSALNVVDWSAAAFGVVALLVGAMLGLAAWDLTITVVASRRLPRMALPETITLGLPGWIIPWLSPVAFVGGILIGHFFWS